MAHDDEYTPYFKIALQQFIDSLTVEQRTEIKKILTVPVDVSKNVWKDEVTDGLSKPTDYTSGSDTGLG